MTSELPNLTYILKGMPVTLKLLKDTTRSVCDTVGRKKDGTYIFRRGYFYTYGMDSDKFRNKLVAMLELNKIHGKVIDHGDHYASFRGNHSIAQGSHWWVIIDFNQAEGT
jgi:hypothetical protein